MSEDKTEVVVVASKVKAAIKDAGFKTSGDAVEARIASYNVCYTKLLRTTGVATTVWSM